MYISFHFIHKLLSITFVYNCMRLYLYINIIGFKLVLVMFQGVSF